MYVIGIDGGGTKTHVAIADLEGTILSEAITGPANYQTCGLEVAENSIRQGVTQVLEDLGLSIKDLAFAYFGLSGADEPMDFDVLVPLCERVLPGVKQQVVNDTWIGLYSGATYGVVSICGTGSAHAGITKEGKPHVFRNLDYLTGNYGGGSQILDQAMHYAFRGHEGTYKATLLTECVMDLFGLATMDEVSNQLREGQIPVHVAYDLPVKVNQLSLEGDEVSIELLRDMGRVLGQYAAAMVVALDMTNEQVPLVGIGSLFASKNPFLCQAYVEEVKKVAPKAELIIPTSKPVVGAIRQAIREVKNHENLDGSQRV